MPGIKKDTTSKSNEYMSKGVTISPAVPESGNNVTIMYDGILSKNGAGHIYAYVGYGNSWQDNSYYKMDKSATGFQTNIPVGNSDAMNMCFKDCADNWDNNSGKNYSFDISK
jgi:hypothetical protein